MSSTTSQITQDLFIYTVLGSTVVATVIGVILTWLKEYFQEKNKWKILTQEKLYGSLSYHLLMIRALNINREELLEEIRGEPAIDDTGSILKSFADVNPINEKWCEHIEVIKKELETNAGYIRKEHLGVVENFLDSFIKREITRGGASIRATPNRIKKIFDSLKDLDSKVLGKQSGRIFRFKLRQLFT